MNAPAASVGLNALVMIRPKIEGIEPMFMMSTSKPAAT